MNSPGALASLIQLGIEWSAGLTRRGPHLGTRTKDTSPYNKHANTRVANMFRHSWFCVSFFLFFFLVFAAKRRRDPAKIIWRCIVCFVSRLWKRRGPRHWRDPGPVLDQMRKCADSGRPGKNRHWSTRSQEKGGRETKKKGVSQLFRSGLIVKTAGRHQKRHQNGTRNGIQNCIQNDPKSDIPKI